ncbi:acyl-CoA thioesterase [Wenxinia saemankumensis]|uniref:Thioesterase-like superfamily protein n=1 Tax=Wenxinia saemankumensis TaxID=1447782 RepID=A0A1M6G7V5_9RHOB|nr:acyl-CoA thioesterase [Wenxinia saemankumensis]SHJ05887.1 Thioesterase-like superfamily protein [Wenxinia saemankumensis]
MYPLIRFAWQNWATRNLPPLGPFDTHVSHHRCWPIDIDLWSELNNGRTLTLYDLGRIPMARRTGVVDLLRQKGWGFTVAASFTRYRRRVRIFEKLTMKSRMIGWDRRFFYMEQSMWRADGECTSHVLIRTALVGRGRAGLIPPTALGEGLGVGPDSPPLPDWVTALVGAEDTRPWPPMAGA